MTRSEELYQRALKTIPWGTQTNAKRPDERMAGVMPFFMERGEGCRLQDVDGKWYIDYRSSLGPIILGYRYPEVDDAVRQQLDKGVLFSMASPLEIDVAELLCDMVPGLEQVRFLKTGNEVNGAAIRLARAFTGRDHIVTCGYHGHGDWFACGEGTGVAWFPREGNGVPMALDDLATRIEYGDVAALESVFEAKGDQIAALLMVPYNWDENVARDFVAKARELSTQHGTVLIFDQVLTGFRLAAGGAQEFFGVIPDMTTYAKAIANGYPLAAYGGRRDIMQKLYDVVLTSTYAGETLSLAAARASLGVIRREGVPSHIWSMGELLMRGFDERAAAAGLDAHSIGVPAAPQFKFFADPQADEAARYVFFRELFARGIFPSRPFLINYSHKEAEIEETLGAVAGALAVVAEEVMAAPR